MTMRRFSPGEIIVKENETGDTAFLIEQGRVESLRASCEGEAHRLRLEAGDVFGEMSLVEPGPRIATVTALEETVVREIRRDGLHAAAKENPEAVVLVLKTLLERFREANARLAGIDAASPASPAAHIPARVESAWPSSNASGKPVVYTIEGLTPQAAEAMSDSPFTFTAFPLKIGRRTNDPVVNNHLEIANQDPLQISRHHVSIVRENGKIGVVDRGSHLGALVDDVRVGGKKNGPGPVFFKGDEGILVLGTDSSPYRYRIRIAP